MKSFFFLLLVTISVTLLAQDPNDNLTTVNKEIYLLADSLWNVEKDYMNRRMDERTYLKISGELLTALSIQAYSNASNYARIDEATEGEPVILEPRPVASSEEIDTVPDNNMEDFSPPKNPINLITGSGKRTSFKLRYGMFWNGVSQGTKQANINYPEFKLWNSYCWFSEFDILLNTRLGKNMRGPLSLYYGIGWDIRQYTQKNNVQQLTLDQGNKAVFEPSTLPQVKEASIDLSYFRIPIGLQYKKKNLALNVGGYIGFLTNHEQKLEYKTSLDEEAELILDKDYNFTKINYGLSASIGYKHLHLAFNYDLNTIFKDNDDYEYNGWKIGLMIF